MTWNRKAEFVPFKWPAYLATNVFRFIYNSLFDMKKVQVWHFLEQDVVLTFFKGDYMTWNSNKEFVPFNSKMLKVYWHPNDAIKKYRFQNVQIQILFWVILRDTTNSTEKIRGIYTVGWNYRRKRPNTVGKRPTVVIILRPRPKKPR